MNLKRGVGKEGGVSKMYKILSLLWLLLHVTYTFIFLVKIGQSKDKILYIKFLLPVVFYLVMMVAS